MTIAEAMRTGRSDGWRSAVERRPILVSQSQIWCESFL